MIYCRWDLLLCLLMATVFFSFPNIDLWVSDRFYVDDHFFLRENTFIQGLYLIFAKIHIPLLLGLTFGLIVTKTKTVRKQLRYLLFVLLIAPGLIVNIALKDNSLGRARPVHVTEFGGDAQYSKAFVYSGQCHHNCSFTSGHAALGFFFISMGWVFRCRKIFTLGMTIGVVVSLGRVVQGGHFLSDVVFSFWIVYFTSLIMAYFYRFNFKAHTPNIALQQN